MVKSPGQAGQMGCGHGGCASGVHKPSHTGMGPGNMKSAKETGKMPTKPKIGTSGIGAKGGETKYLPKTKGA